MAEQPAVTCRLIGYVTIAGPPDLVDKVTQNKIEGGVVTDPYRDHPGDFGYPNKVVNVVFAEYGPPAPPSIPDLIARWRETFAPADREALWKAITGTGGYMVNGVRYLATAPCMGSDQRYSIEVS